MVWYLNGGMHRESLEDAVLAGARQTRGAVCLDVAGDFSSSMSDNATTRGEALALLKPFMSRQMEPGDLLSAVAFASTASMTLASTKAADLSGVSESVGDQVQGQYTYFAPAIRALDRGHTKEGTKCVRRVLVAITDGEFADEVNRLVPLIQRFDRVYLAVPGEASDYRPPLFASSRLGAVVTQGFGGAEDLSLLYGRALAAATGQQLVRR
ncbi:hypothetical protein [Streptosporangium sp. NPDC004631]